VYDPVSFLPTSIAGPGQSLNPDGTSGTAAYTAHDSYGRVSYTVAPSQSAGGTGARTSYTYGYTSGAWTVTATTNNTGGGNHWTKTTLDGLGRTVSVQAGHDSTTLSEVDTAYTPCACGPVGKTSWQSQPYQPPNSTPPGTTYTYDALGRTTNVLLADGASHTQYLYQGNATTVIDPATKWKQYLNDAFGNLVTVLEPDPTSNPGPPSSPPVYPVTSAPSNELLTSYTYDQLGHLTQVTMPRSTGTQTRTFIYDPTTQRLTSATNPENSTVSYTYNADGTLASKLDANGNTETYTYDSYGRLTGIPDRHQTFTWDTCPVNDFFCTSAPGKMVEAAFGSNNGPNQLSFQYDYTYTPAGKVASKTLTLQSANHLGMGGIPANGSLTASYNYDNQGALTSMIYPTAETAVTYPPVQTFTYTLDAMERPTGLSSDYPNYWTWVSGVTYNAAGQTSYNGRTYNNLGQVTQVGNTTYNYSATQNNGQISSSGDALTGETITYQYDALKRLSTATSSQNWGETYTYDGFGNLNQMTPTGSAPSLSVSVDAATNRILPTGVSYDNNGNVTAGFGGLHLSYDAANRVGLVLIGTSYYHYGYDPDNLRIYYRDASNAETIYFYGADGRKLATYTYSIVTFNNNPAIQLVQQSENVYFTGILVSATTDRLGSVTHNGAGDHRYYPYGVEYTTSTNDTEKYATYTRDSLTGLDYAVNRYYSSQWGRFLSPDPYRASDNSRDPQSWNRYAYVGNDPINFVDSTGQNRVVADCSWDQVGWSDEGSGTYWWVCGLDFWSAGGRGGVSGGGLHSGNFGLSLARDATVQSTTPSCAR